MKITINVPKEKAGETVKYFSNAFTILKFVAGHFGLTVAELESRRRDWPTVWARWCAIGLIHRYTLLSTVKIGLLLNRNHSSILNGLNRLQDQIQTAPKDAATFEVLNKHALSLNLKPIRDLQLTEAA